MTISGPDLDNRPAPLARSTLPYWVQYCPSCKYCADQISDGLPAVKKFIETEPYQKQLINTLYPELANRFLCSSMIYENTREYHLAALNALHAAWACDDIPAIELAENCRRRAIELFQTALANNAIPSEEVELTETIMADLFRRTSQFDKVLTICDEILKKSSESDIHDLLNAQKFLAARQDVERQDLDTVKEIMGNDASHL